MRERRVFDVVFCGRWVSCIVWRNRRCRCYRLTLERAQWLARILTARLGRREGRVYLYADGWRWDEV